MHIADELWYIEQMDTLFKALNVVAAKPTRNAVIASDWYLGQLFLSYPETMTNDHVPWIHLASIAGQPVANIEINKMILRTIAAVVQWELYSC